MPGKSPYDAFQAFVNPIREAIACVAHAKLTHSAGGATSEDQVNNLILNRGQGAELRGFVGDPSLRVRLVLDIRMKYKIIRDPRNGPYRVTTLAYDHEIAMSSGEVIVNYHWHPVGNSHEQRSHLHVGTSQLSPTAVLSTKHHVPTGRVSIEQVIRQAIELGAEPLCDDWEKRLDAAEAPFVEHRSWS